eukprot:gene15302-biopygen9707
MVHSLTPRSLSGGIGHCLGPPTGSVLKGGGSTPPLLPTAAEPHPRRGRAAVARERGEAGGSTSTLQLGSAQRGGLLQSTTFGTRIFCRLP